MCGLIGIINKKWDATLSVPTESVFKQLIYAGGLRGFDSTGVFKVTKDHKVTTVKKASPAGWFLGIKETQDFINDYWKDSIAVFAHNRKATMGNKDDETAHPFMEDPITLIHNGTLSSWDRSNNTLSDSHYICKRLAEENKEFKPLESFRGAFALIWHNSLKKQINFCRNSERPLWIIEAKDWYLLVSEREMGEWILLRNGHDVLDAIEVAENFIYKMSWKNNKLHITKIKFTPFKPKFEIPNPLDKIPNRNFLLTEDDDDYTGFGQFAQKEVEGFTRLDKPYQNQRTEYRAQNLVGTELTLMPYLATKEDFTTGGYSYWAGQGIKEERMELTARIHFPLNLAGKKAKWSVPMNEWEFDIINKMCKASYAYQAGTSDDPWIKVTGVHIAPIQQNKQLPVLLNPVSNVIDLPTCKTKPKNSTENDVNDLVEDSLAGIIADQTPIEGEETFVKTYNDFCITDNNWETIAEEKCAHCETPFEFDSAEQSIIGEKWEKGVLQSYTYICPDCLEHFRNRKKKKQNSKTLSIENKSQTIRPAA